LASPKINSQRERALESGYLVLALSLPLSDQVTSGGTLLLSLSFTLLI
jgi:hypothetical protein